MKTLKSAATQLLSDVLNNRCMKIAIRNAVEGLSIDSRNKIILCCNSRDTGSTVRDLKELIENLNEYVVTLHIDGQEFNTVYRGDEEEALKLFRGYVLQGQKVSLTVV